MKRKRFMRNPLRPAENDTTQGGFFMRAVEDGGILYGSDLPE